VYFPHFGHQKTLAVAMHFRTILVDTQFLGNKRLIGLEPYPYQSHLPAWPEDQDQEKVGKKGSHQCVQCARELFNAGKAKLNAANSPMIFRKKRLIKIIGDSQTPNNQQLIDLFRWIPI
jgi:hypothetical protein